MNSRVWQFIMAVSKLFWLPVGEYGVPKRWNFLFTKSYWCSKYSYDDVGVSRQNIELEFNNEGHFHYFSLRVYFKNIVSRFWFIILMFFDCLISDVPLFGVR